MKWRSFPRIRMLSLFVNKVGFSSQDGGLRFDNQDSTFSGPAFGFSSFGIPVRERGITALAFHNAKI